MKEALATRRPFSDAIKTLSKAVSSFEVQLNTLGKITIVAVNTFFLQ